MTAQGRRTHLWLWGRYPLTSRATLLQGITIAGSFTPVVGRNELMVIRFSEEE